MYNNNELKFNKIKILTIGDLIGFLETLSSEDFVEIEWEGISVEIKGYKHDKVKGVLYINADQW